MSLHDDGEFGAAYWEDRYHKGGGASRRDPSPSLLAEPAVLPPGRALDAGCGWGADARWLASRGWHVTAVDVSPTAVDEARQAAEAADPAAATRITWITADLTSWDPGPTRFDLVASHYVHVPGPPEALFARLASWVAPGGTLLVVGHGYTPGQHSGQDVPDAYVEHLDSAAAGARIRIDQITASLPGGDWELVVAEPRTHTITRPNGAPPTRVHDVVVQARRVKHVDLAAANIARLPLRSTGSGRHSKPPTP